MTVRVQAKVSADKASPVFKQARKDVRERTKMALLAAGEDVALPAAKRGASHLKVEGVPVNSTLVVRARPTSAYLTTTLRGRRGRAVGLLEFGGTVGTKVEPKRSRRGKGGHAPAVFTPFGPRANVTRPRHYKGQFFLTHSVERNEGRIDERILKELMHLFDGLEHTP